MNEWLLHALESQIHRPVLSRKQVSNFLIHHVRGEVFAICRRRILLASLLHWILWQFAGQDIVYKTGNFLLNISRFFDVKLNVCLAVTPGSGCLGSRCLSLRQGAKRYIETLDFGRCSSRAIDLWPWLSPVNCVSQYLLRRCYPPHLDQAAEECLLSGDWTLRFGPSKLGWVVWASSVSSAKRPPFQSSSFPRHFCHSRDWNLLLRGRRCS